MLYSLLNIDICTLLTYAKYLRKGSHDLQRHGMLYNAIVSCKAISVLVKSSVYFAALLEIHASWSDAEQVASNCNRPF